MSDQPKLNILLIEDNGMFLNIAEEMLKDHNIVSVKTADAGVEAYKKHKPDITFLDIALPDGSGHDVLRKIKKNDNSAYIVMMTGSRLREDVIKSMDEGANGYIMKPFSSDMIDECINDFLKEKSQVG